MAVAIHIDNSMAWGKTGHDRVGSAHAGPKEVACAIHRGSVSDRENQNTKPLVSVDGAVEFVEKGGGVSDNGKTKAEERR